MVMVPVATVKIAGQLGVAQRQSGARSAADIDGLARLGIANDDPACQGNRRRRTRKHADRVALRAGHIEIPARVERERGGAAQARERGALG